MLHSPFFSLSLVFRFLCLLLQYTPWDKVFQVYPPMLQNMLEVKEVNPQNVGVCGPQMNSCPLQDVFQSCPKLFWMALDPPDDLHVDKHVRFGIICAKLFYMYNS